MRFPASPLLWRAALAAALLLAATLAIQHHLFQRLWYGASTARAEQHWAGRSIWLTDYRNEAPPIAVAGVLDNLSGLAWDPGRDRLWAVVNDPTTLLLLDKRGGVEARYPLPGFHDVEAVTWIDGDLLLLAEERRGTQVLITVPASAGPIPRDQARVLPLHEPSEENDGFEGSAYDAAGDRLFVVKERNPMRLLEYPRLRASLALGQLPQPIDRSAWLFPQVFAHDLSSIDSDPVSGHLLLLSHESRRLFELGRDGRLVSFRSLAAGDDAIGVDIPQAEGVALDGQGNLFMVSEPNLFYRFDRPLRVAAEPALAAVPAGAAPSPPVLAPAGEG